MTKTQRVWLLILLSFFIVPEVLWSPATNFLYELIYNTGLPLRNNFLEKTNNINTLSTVLFIQFLGLLLTSVYLILISRFIKNKFMLWLSQLFLFLFSTTVFIFLGLSISLRHIGF